MKKIYILAAAIILLVPSLALSNTLSFRAGYYFPHFQGGQDSLWTIEFDQMSFKKSDFRQSILGFSYEYFISKELSLALTVDTYHKMKAGFYKDYVGFSGFEEGSFAFPASEFKGDDIVHAFSVSITPVQLSVKLTPFGRRSKLIPYVGGGVSLFFWKVGIRGDTIDFGVDYLYTDKDLGDITVYKINPSDLQETGRITIGYHAFGGLMFPIGNRVTLEAEFRYHAAKGKLTDAFKGFEDFDLGGFSLSAGLNYWF